MGNPPKRPRKVTHDQLFQCLIRYPAIQVGDAGITTFFDVTTVVSDIHLRWKVGNKIRNTVIPESSLEEVFLDDGVLKVKTDTGDWCSIRFFSFQPIRPDL